MLTDKLRAELQQPFGDLCSNANCAEKLRAYSKIVTVGDITTYNVVQAGIVPDVSIIDGITMREKVPDDICSAISTDPRVIYKVDNPPGSISRQLCNAVSSSMERVARSERVRIVVNGEEDLAVIPAVVEAPLGAAVVYGQPNKGMVIIAITRERKEKARQLMHEILKITPK
ncbi:MAG: GTP-dependent dephospho-CoA kinase family protein [Halobacteriota archaeon]|jgi:uncharacterized protein (UPF0218 family)